MNVEQDVDLAASGIAAAIGEPARARMLYCLADGRARTGTELAIVGDVSPSTASVHLSRLKAEGLVTVVVQGKHRYYSLSGPEVARLLEGLSVLAGGRLKPFVPRTPQNLRAARTCYDHIAGTLGVAMHDRFVELAWIAADGKSGEEGYLLTSEGRKGVASLGIDEEGAFGSRRRFAYACLDWSERRSHLGGSLAASILKVALERTWIERDLNSRALTITRAGSKQLEQRIGLKI